MHWDFVIEVSGQEQLATWRLASNPLVPQPLSPAERIAGHHPAFLEYEGELARAPGRVRRRDRGDSTIIHHAGQKLVAALHGVHLSGIYEIAPTDAGALVFRRVADPVSD